MYTIYVLGYEETERNHKDFLRNFSEVAKAGARR